MKAGISSLSTAFDLNGRILTINCSATRVKRAPADAIDAAFAALARLDCVVRSEPVFAGVWRQRLAPSAAEPPKLPGLRARLIKISASGVGVRTRTV